MILVSYLQNEVAQVLGCQTSQLPNDGFFDMGMDSLMASELVKRLSTVFKVSISSTLMIEYPSIEELADYLLNDVLALGRPEKSATVESPPNSVMVLKDIQALSEEESIALIDQELGVLFN